MFWKWIIGNNTFHINNMPELGISSATNRINLAISVYLAYLARLPPLLLEFAVYLYFYTYCCLVDVLCLFLWLLLVLLVVKPTYLDTVLNHLSVLQGASYIFSHLILSQLVFVA